MRSDLTSCIRQQLAEEQENHGGEYVFIVSEDNKNIECSINCSEGMLMTVVDHLIDQISQDGLHEMALRAVGRLTKKEETK